MIDQAEIHRKADSSWLEDRKEAAGLFGKAFLDLSDKGLAWQDLHKLTQDMNSVVRLGAAESLGSAFPHVPDKEQAWQDLHKLTQDENSYVRRRAAESLGSAFPHVPDKEQAWQDLIWLTQKKDRYVRRRAAESLGSAFPCVPDKIRVWQDLVWLTQKKDRYVRRRAVESLGSAFPWVPDKIEVWQDLHKLTQHEDMYVRWKVAELLGSAFLHNPDKEQAWQDLLRLAQDKDKDVRWTAGELLGLVVSYVPEKEQAWQDLLRLAQDKSSFMQWDAVKLLGSVFTYVPDKAQAWQNLRRLILDENIYVRQSAAESLGSAFPHIPDKDQAWQDLLKLTQDESSNVRMYAYHSIGKASVHKATESEDIDAIRRHLEEAVGYFEKSAKESEYSPAKFCHPFYRSYFALTFQGESQEAIQKYLAEAKRAVGGSESRDELLRAVENLAEALQEAQRTRDMQLAGMQCDLKAYMRYCNQAAESLNQVEKDAPGAAKLIRKGLPNIDQQIKSIIGSIQEKAQTICIQGKGTGTALEAAGLELNHWAKELSIENVLKSERSCSRMEYTLQNFCSRLPVDKRSNICEVIKEIGMEEELPNKLSKIELALSFILNEWPIDYDVRKKLDEIHDDIKSLRQSTLDRFDISEQKILSSVFERLDKDKLEIISCLLDAIKENRIPKDLTEEALKATRDLIAEMKSIQIQDPKIAKCVDSWEEAINSPELGIENMIKVTIPIIPFLLTYEGSYKFQTSMKLDSTWNKLRALVRR